MNALWFPRGGLLALQELPNDLSSKCQIVGPQSICFPLPKPPGPAPKAPETFLLGYVTGREPFQHSVTPPAPAATPFWREGDCPSLISI